MINQKWEPKSTPKRPDKNRQHINVLFQRKLKYRIAAIRPMLISILVYYALTVWRKYPSPVFLLIGVINGTFGESVNIVA